MLEIIKCKCGYYKQLNDELCPKCGADYSLGAEYEELDDQETAYERWNRLGGEKGFNEYMNSINQPQFMICPKCKFKMLVSETTCPRCGISVRYKGTYKTPLITKLALGASYFQLIVVGVPAIILCIFIIYGVLAAIFR